MAVKGSCPVASLGDDLTVEFLSRLPVRSLHHCKCVSKAWRNLIAHPDHRRKLPQALAGFFHGMHRQRRDRLPAIGFVNLSGEKGFRPSLAFLPAEYHEGIVFLDCCNGLLLLLPCCDDSSDPRYIVCNPATEKWVALPTSASATSQQQAAGGNMYSARLCFDPAVSPHFHVIEFDAEDITAVLNVYSSRTGEWAREVKGWGGGGDYSFLYGLESPPAFLNGRTHFLAFDTVCAIDMESKAWRSAAAVSAGGFLAGGSLHVSQGRLHYAKYELDHHCRCRTIRFAVYVLNDGDGCGDGCGEPAARSRWTLKHGVGIEHLSGGSCFGAGCLFREVAMHPDCNLMFFVDRRRNALMSYDMDRRMMVQVARNFGSDSCPPYAPYVPFYSEFAHGSLT